MPICPDCKHEIDSVTILYQEQNWETYQLDERGELEEVHCSDSNMGFASFLCPDCDFELPISSRSELIKYLKG